MKVYILFLLIAIAIAEGKDTCKNKYIEENEHGYYIDYDSRWKIYGTFLFTDDLICHIASSGREVCLQNKSADKDLICLRDIILSDIHKIIFTSETLNFKKLQNYKLISSDDSYKQTPYSNLFKSLFFLNKSFTRKSKNKNITPQILTQYNDIAYYLQKAGANEEAVYLLKKIVAKFPNRTVAYINLGDAYWELGEKEKARKAYTTYIEQMCNKGLQKKIPQEVLKRVEVKDVCK